MKEIFDAFSVVVGIWLAIAILCLICKILHIAKRGNRSSQEKALCSIF